jgi:putative drug exporter of the RND superfamily
LVGLAVGVDYCMFYVRREREERARGAGPRRALVIAAQTSGRSVWISGLTVMIAMAGMLFTRDTTFTSFALGTILVVATAVLGSLTVLPALLSALGDRVDLGKIPGLYRRRTTSRIWAGLMRIVLSRPLVSAVLAAAALGALAWPALDLRTKGAGLDDVSPHSRIVQTFHRIQAAFPGGADPAHVVVRADDVTGPAFDDALTGFRRLALASGQLHEPINVEVNPDRTVAVVSVGLSGSGTDRTSEEALSTLRGTVLPATLNRLPGAWVGVTGSTAGSHDFNDQLKGSMPLVFTFVLGLAFVLLLLSFRSIVVAATGVLLNALSVAAAYGMLVFIFQDGHGESLLDFTATGGITNWMPLFLFVILFGLSMDYHVFVLSRIREGHDRGLPTRRAVADGITGTAGVITSAAVVMVAVFSLFTTLPLTSTKEIGVGLAAAVLLDATLIRAVLLPSVMALLGEHNWYLPRWLRWLPQVSHDLPARRRLSANTNSPGRDCASGPSRDAVRGGPADGPVVAGWHLRRVGSRRRAGTDRVVIATVRTLRPRRGRKARRPCSCGRSFASTRTRPGARPAGPIVRGPPRAHRRPGRRTQRRGAHALHRRRPYPVAGQPNPTTPRRMPGSRTHPLGPAVDPLTGSTDRDAAALAGERDPRPDRGRVRPGAA